MLYKYADNWHTLYSFILCLWRKETNTPLLSCVQNGKKKQKKKIKCEGIYYWLIVLYLLNGFWRSKYYYSEHIYLSFSYSFLFFSELFFYCLWTPCTQVNKYSNDILRVRLSPLPNWRTENIYVYDCTCTGVWVFGVFAIFRGAQTKNNRFLQLFRGIFFATFPLCAHALSLVSNNEASREKSWQRRIPLLRGEPYRY